MKFSQTFGQAPESRAGLLQMTLVGIATVDRVGFAAWRSQPSWPEGKLFTTSICSAAKFFTSRGPSMQALPETLLRLL